MSLAIASLCNSHRIILGKPIVGDFDGDGYTDLIVPGYSANKIYVFTYAP